MRCTLATLAFAAVAVANPVPAGVSSAIKPSSSPPPGCSSDYSGSFQIQVVKKTSKRDVSKRQDSALLITLSGGVLMDDQGRTGYIASNSQFQFDSPPQAGAIYTAGFSVCQNGDLALGADTTWYQCKSGNFYNLYDQNVLSTGQCSPVYIRAVGGSPSPSASAAPSSSSAAPVSSTPAPTGPASTVVYSSTVPVTQISDGQPQASTAVIPVTQISDGQIQASTAVAPVTQISDGQVQAPTGCTQYVDGQPQCSSAAPIPSCTQIVDGQPQCPGSTGYPAPSYGANSSYASPSASVVPATGAASTTTLGSAIFGLIAGVAAVAFL